MKGLAYKIVECKADLVSDFTVHIYYQLVAFMPFSLLFSAFFVRKRFYLKPTLQIS